MQLYFYYIINIYFINLLNTVITPDKNKYLKWSSLSQHLSGLKVFLLLLSHVHLGPTIDRYGTISKT